MEAAQIGEHPEAFLIFALQAVRRALLRYLAVVWDGAGDDGRGGRFFAELRDRAR